MAMPRGKPESPAHDFLPRRSETLRESFQEKMRQRGSHRSGRSGGSRDEVRFLEMEHGPRPEVDHLNDGFHPGASRLKATLDVFGFDSFAGDVPAGMVERLLEAFPRLERHRCCGGHDVHFTLFRRGRGGGSEPPEPDPGLAFCHLLEHLALELLGAMAPERPCAGITCAYREPAHRFDLFLECEDGRVGAVALRCAAHVLTSLHRPGEMPPGTSRYAETARYFLRRPRSLLNPGEVLADLQGEPTHLQAAMRFLAVSGFLGEERFTYDFGETTLYRYRLAPALPPLPVILSL
jgi:hypothetical protein